MMCGMDSADRRKRYQMAFREHGATPQAMQWRDYPAAARRYQQLVADADIAGRTILDAGCGMGDLLPFLYAKNTDFSYLGADITPEFIAVARQRYAGQAFTVADPFSEDFTDRFDIIFCSGVLNAKQPDWLAARMRMIDKLYGQANTALAFNMAGSADALPDTTNATRVTYAPVEEILKACFQRTKKLVLRAQYHPRDFTVTMFH